MKLIKFILPVHRSSDLVTVEVVTEEEYQLILDFAEQKRAIYYGEVAGKHSDVWFVLGLDDVDILTEDEGEIALFKKWFPEGVVGISLMWAIHETFETDLPEDQSW